MNATTTTKTTKTTKTTYTVRTDIGTVSRTTARTYAFVVVARGLRIDVLEKGRIIAAAHWKKQVADYTAVVDGRRAPLGQLARDLYVTDFLPNAIRNQENNDADYDARIAAANDDATTPVDTHSGVWSSRLDLARREYDKLATNYRDVRLVDVATGRELFRTEGGR